jgi:hypothetical protein
MSLFANAKAAAPAKKPTAKKADAVHFHALEGLEQFASICAVEKALEAIKKTIEADLKAAGVDIMVTEGLRLQRRPESIKASEGKAVASIQLKAKASNIAISEDDQQRLGDAEIPLRTVDVVTETFIFNPAYASDEKIQGKVSDALMKLIKKGDLPEDIIQHQQDQKVVCDGDTTLNAIFALKDRALVEALLPLVTSTAIKPTLTAELDVAIANVANLLGGSLAAPAKPSAKAKKAAKGADCAIAA